MEWYPYVFATDSLTRLEGENKQFYSSPGLLLKDAGLFVGLSTGSCVRELRGVPGLRGVEGVDMSLGPVATGARHNCNQHRSLAGSKPNEFICWSTVDLPFPSECPPFEEGIRNPIVIEAVKREPSNLKKTLVFV